jgi:hypothetical protein
MYVGGGKNNDIIDVAGDFVRSIIDGNKDNDNINVVGGTYTDSSVNGGEGDDVITAASTPAGGGSTGLVMNGDLGNDNLLSEFNLNTLMTGGEGNDTIDSISNAGATSVINGGVGADKITLREGGRGPDQSLETIIFNQGDSVAATEFVSFTPKGPKAVFGNGVDNITGFGPGSDKVDINFAPPATINQLSPILDSGKLLEVGTITELKGTFTFENNEFLFEGTGSDYLYVVGGENLTIEQTLTSSSNMFVSVGSKLSIGDFV